MSEDLIKLVQDLINSKKGDEVRLGQILETLQNGNQPSLSDQQYLESLTASTPSENVISEQSGSIIPEPAESTIPSSTSDSLDNKPGTQVEAKTAFRRIAIAAIIAAIVVVAYGGLDVYAVNALQFRPHNGSQTIISDTELKIQADACNPSYFPANFNTYEIIAIYKSDTIEKATISGSTISPKSSTILDGVFTLNKDAATKFGSTNSSFDPTQARITTKVSAPIFGIIPYSVNKEYSVQDFQHIVRDGPPGSYSCQ